MAKKPGDNKALQPGSNKMVKVRILPLRGIGGIGGPGDEGMLPEDQALQYVADGYCEIISNEEPQTVQTTAQ